MRFDVISIGCLSKNLLWGETQSARTPHATTTLIRAGKRNILVDPGLPGAVLAARLYERTGLKPEEIDTVFLTNYRPAHRAGVSAFPRAKVLLFEAEKEFVLPRLEQLAEAAGEDDGGGAAVIRQELELLEKMKVADDKLAPNVDLFPLPGFTPGTCGLLVSLPTASVLIAGDGVPTQDHFLAMQTLPDGHDVRQAGESMREVYEIADLIVPGHDNVFINPRTQGM